jgi:beta-galactosidase
MASFQQPVRKTFMGKCLAIVRPGKETGRIRIKATSEGLKDANVEVVVK